MSGETGLAEALAAMQARAATHTATEHSASRPESDALAVLRGVAILQGVAPGPVIEDFLRGGALAELVRAVLGSEARRVLPRGPQPRDDVLQSYFRVAALIGAGHSQGKAIAIHAEETGIDVETIKQRYRRRRKHGGAIAAAFGPNTAKREPGT